MKRHLILLFLLWNTALMAQNVLMRDDAGEIKAVALRDVEDATPYNRQFEIKGTNAEGNVVAYTPETADGYQLSSRKVWISCTFDYEGETRRLFLHRTETYRDSIYFLAYYPDKATLKPIYFLQLRGDQTVYRLTDDPQTGYVSPLTSWLMSYPIAQDPDVRAYFERMKANPTSFKERHQLARSGYASHLPKWKWGVLAGMNLSQVLADDFSMDLTASATVGLFADLPIGHKDGLSYHPELTFEKYAAKGKMKDNQPVRDDVAYNTTTIATTQLVRYSAIWVHSRFVPFFDLGATLGMNVRRKMEYKFITTVLDMKSKRYVSREFMGKEDLETLTLALVAGLGVEWQYDRHHSIYFSTRFFKDRGNISRIGGSIQIAFNL